MASQSADTEGDRNQDHPLRPPVPSIRGKSDRPPAAGILRSHVVLDDGRPRKQAARFQDLPQPPSRAYGTGRENAGYAHVTTTSQSPLVSLATTLSSPLSDPGGCLICQRLALAVVLVDLANTCKEIIRCFSITAGFAGSHRSLRPDTARLPIRSVPITIRQRQVQKLEANKAKRAAKRELIVIVVATMISRMIGTPVFSDRMEFSAITGGRMPRKLESRRSQMLRGP